MLRHALHFIKKETVLSAAWLLALLSAFLIPPSEAYLAYIDFRSLGILWSLMIIMAGLKKNGFFDAIGRKLLLRTSRVWQLSAVLVFLCFFFSMFITNDVALITFVPFAMFMLEQCGQHRLLIPVIALQTLAANLGSMLTPIGNPQNLYLYGISGMSLGAFVRIMLPYTLVTGVLLAISVALLPGGREEIRRPEGRTPSADGAALTDGPVKVGGAASAIETALHLNQHGIPIVPEHLQVPIYGGLFLLSMLTIARILPYYIPVFIVLLVVWFMDRDILITIDYALLFTFIGFFIFTGNLGELPAVSRALTRMVVGREVMVGVLASQVISNVPAALLLSAFTDRIPQLVVGVNLGGLGTLIASMASLISFKSLAYAHNERKGRYFLVFTALNLIYLAVLLGVYLIL